jgi:hypothetical protein
MRDVYPAAGRVVCVAFLGIVVFGRAVLVDQVVFVNEAAVVVLVVRR